MKLTQRLAGKFVALKVNRVKLLENKHVNFGNATHCYIYFHIMNEAWLFFIKHAPLLCIKPISQDNVCETCGAKLPTKEALPTSLPTSPLT